MWGLVCFPLSVFYFQRDKTIFLYCIVDYVSDYADDYTTDHAGDCIPIVPLVNLLIMLVNILGIMLLIMLVNVLGINYATYRATDYAGDCITEYASDCNTSYVDYTIHCAADYTTYHDCPVDYADYCSINSQLYPLYWGHTCIQEQYVSCHTLRSYRTYLEYFPNIITEELSIT